MNEELLSLLKYRQKVQRKQAQATWSEYRVVVRISRNETRKAKAF